MKIDADCGGTIDWEGAAALGAAVGCQLLCSKNGCPTLCAESSTAVACCRVHQLFLPEEGDCWQLSRRGATSHPPPAGCAAGFFLCVAEAPSPQPGRGPLLAGRPLCLQDFWRRDWRGNQHKAAVDAICCCESLHRYVTGGRDGQLR